MHIFWDRRSPCGSAAVVLPAFFLGPQDYPHTLIVVSHDRMFLNEVCTDIIHFHRQSLAYYRGNYDAFEKIRLTHAQAQAKIRESAEAKKAHMQKFIDKFRFNANRAALVQSRIKALERVKAQEAEELALVNGQLEDEGVDDELLMEARIVFPEPEKLDASVGSRGSRARVCVCVCVVVAFVFCV